MRRTRNRLHVCASNVFGFCTPCATVVNRFLLASAAMVTFTVSVPETFSSLERRRIGRKVTQAAKVAKVAQTAAKAAQRAADAVTAEADRRAANVVSEAQRAAEGAARRAIKAAEKAAKVKAAGIAAQASLIALRVSQDATYRVWIRFARGAHAILIATVAPKGFREARASVKVRGDSPGLRYGAAERIRDGISRKMAAPRRHA
jgi:hypothetical protein